MKRDVSLGFTPALVTVPTSTSASRLRGGYIINAVYHHTAVLVLLVSRVEVIQAGYFICLVDIGVYGVADVCVIRNVYSLSDVTA